VESFTELQVVTGQWRDHNFPVSDDHNDLEQAAFEQLAGIVEEMGEISHAFLKQVQGIRKNEDLQDKEMDAIGDLVIYLCGYCDRRGYSLFECIARAWNEVKDRDWIKWPETGRPPEPTEPTVRVVPRETGRPALCPHCGYRTTSHTGTYCHRCGQDLFDKDPA